MAGGFWLVDLVERAVSMVLYGSFLCTKMEDTLHYILVAVGLLVFVLAVVLIVHGSVNHTKWFNKSPHRKKNG